MNRRQLLACAAGMALTPAIVSAAPTRKVAFGAARPPITPIRPLKIEQLGRTRIDDYAWLKSTNWKDVLRDPTTLNPDIRRHLEAENAYAEAVLAPTRPLQQKIFEELKARTGADNVAPPVVDGPFEYYQRYAAGAQHPLYARRPVGGGPEEVLLDSEAEAKGAAFHHISLVRHSDDHRLFAWTEDTQGAERYRVKVKDIASGKVVSTTEAAAFGDFVFSPDSQWLFWNLRDANSRPAKVMRRPARGGEDVVVYEETDPAFFLRPVRTASRAWIVLQITGSDTSEMRLIPGARPTAAPVVVEPRSKGLYYDLDHWNGRFVIRTNAGGAVDFKLMWADEKAPGQAGWREWLPEQRGRLITHVQAFEGHLVRLERRDANLRLVVTDAKTLADHEITQAEAAYTVRLEPDQAFATSTLRFVYESPRTPPEWFDYDMVARTRRLLKAQRAPGYQPEGYEVRRLSAPAPDDQVVPITVLMKKGVKLDGTAPILLYGYAAYGWPMDPDFQLSRLPLVDRGWIYAIAHARGGSDKGWGWYLDARQTRKMNSFTDFIACAEHLVGQGYGRKGRIVIHGASAGGLLVGASLNLRPDLWAGCIAQVPFVDVLNTMSDAEHPLVPVCRPDWGDPLVDTTAYDYIESYSPYDQVAAKAYPPVLATTSISDDRVFYWEPAKWIARLRARSTRAEPLIVKTAMAGGHNGSSGRFDSLREAAELNAFAIAAAG